MSYFSIGTLGLFVLFGGLSGCASLNAERIAPPIGRFADIENEKLHYIDTGELGDDRRAIVLIHGASANLRDMEIALLDELSNEFRVLIVDRPGRGYSTRPDDGYQLGVQASLIKKLSDERGLKDPIVLGQSLGGAVALRYALDYPGDLSALVVLAPVSHEWPGGVVWYNSIAPKPVIGHLLRYLVVPLYGQLVAEGSIEESFAPNDAPEDYYRRSGLPLLFRPGDFKSNATDIANLKAEIIAQQDRYGSIKVPTLIITGEDDTTVSPEIHSRTLQTQIPNVEAHYLPDTGHALQHSRAAFIVAEVKDLAASLGN